MTENGQKRNPRLALTRRSNQRAEPAAPLSPMSNESTSLPNASGALLETTIQTGLPTVIGPCGLNVQKQCATSPGFPGMYSSLQRCTIRGLPAVPLSVVLVFDVERSRTGLCEYDFLTVGGERFCGTSGPDWVVA